MSTQAIARLGLVVFALAACGIGDSATPQSTSTLQTSTALPATSSTTESPVDPTAATSEEPGSVTTSSIPTNELASGSGCTPGTPETLPDGRWYGLIVEAAGTDIAFDLACWFSGDAAIVAAAEDGAESPPPNDYHVRNNSSRVRTLTVAPGADVSWLANPGDPATAEVIEFPTWLVDRQDRFHQPAVWLTVEGGVVTGIEEQYVP